jgi:hypothetical protein
MLAGFLVCTGVQWTLAQEASTQGQSYIMGFLLVPWGSDTTSIKAAYGRPLIARVTEDSGLVLIYRDAALGTPLLSLFYLDKNKGLVKGVSSIPYGAGSDCETVFRKSKESILRIYPTLTPVEDRKVQDTTTTFCAAAAAGKASWTVTWTDPTSHNSVQVALEPEENRVEVTYQSGNYQPPSADKN